MATPSVLTLLDDIAALLDDVAVLSRTAAKKTAGVVGDDLALNAEQVTGVGTDRELPVVWAVAKGALLNKLILVPAALAISAFLPAAILPLLMLGGVFLCYEGFEKVWHKLAGHGAADTERAERAARLGALADPAADLVSLERAKIKGAIRTDFILSAEIIVIALGTMATATIGRQVAALSVIAIGITLLVYGLVAGVVKLDDLGLKLHRSDGGASRTIGAGILRTAPVLMKGLSILGTAAMFMVGGSIVAHGIPPVEHLVVAVTSTVVPGGGVPGTVVRTVLEAVVGVVTGGLVVAVVGLGKRGSRRKPGAGA
jgi:predicted DNA repair protein MutK